MIVIIQLQLYVSLFTDLLTTMSLEKMVNLYTILVVKIYPISQVFFTPAEARRHKDLVGSYLIQRSAMPADFFKSPGRQTSHFFKLGRKMGYAAITQLPGYFGER